MRVKNKIVISGDNIYVRCAMCKRYLPESSFYKLSDRKHASYCIACACARSKKYYRKITKKHEEITHDDIIFIKVKKPSDIDNNLVEKIIRKTRGSAWQQSN